MGVVFELAAVVVFTLAIDVVIALVAGAMFYRIGQLRWLDPNVHWGT